MHTFATTAPITAVIDIPAGRVQLVAADRADATVEVRPADATRSRDVKAAEQATVDFTDGVLRIAAATANQILGPSGSLEVVVQLPAGSRVQAKAAGADVRGAGRFGEVAFEGSQGDIKFDEAAGVHVRTAAGDVTVGRLTGSAEITTSKGDIEITEATGGKVALSTQSGNVTIGAASGVSASLDAGTGHGRVTNSLKNDGATVLDIHATTAYGDIVARSL
ncbi:DUF4097 family beta strand repeat-containing protein [Actinoplanes sp. NPDC051861]|uniref:DUF4097 family beta strand repeat-containing protein n=1 Tax=Actinoplanes sp. NPDC051861 TaxID=3155170 RepID=UPI003426B919